MKTHASTTLVTAAFLGLTAAASANGLYQVSKIDAGSGLNPSAAEILSYLKDANVTNGNVLAATYSSPANGVHGVQLLSVTNSLQIAPVGNAVLVDTANAIDNTGFTGTSLASVTSTALDPSRRGFGVATLVPAANGTTPGRLAFYDYASGNVLGTLAVGFHPDSVTISADGTKIFVANEGEFTGDFDGNAGNGNTPIADAGAKGSVSVIDISSLTAGNVNAGTIAGLSALDFTFDAANLAPGVSTAGLRNNNRAGLPGATIPTSSIEQAIEPEYIAYKDGKAYITLQENNAVAVLDTTDANPANWKYTAIHDLGTIKQTIDGRDGGGASITSTVRGLPMPDTIATFESGGKTYLITANEGDARVDDFDINRFSNTSTTGFTAGTGLETGFDTEGSTLSTGRTTNTNGHIGRLNIDRVLGDDGIDADGNALGTADNRQLDQILMIGTRSVAIWDADTGDLLIDTGSLEQALLTLDPTRHNMNRTGSIDTRSDDKGPEVESIDVGSVNGTNYLFVGNERQGGLLMFNLDALIAKALGSTTPISYLNDNTAQTLGLAIPGLVSPESMFFVDAADSPNGNPFLLVGYEGHDDAPATGYGIGLYSVPEPTTATLSALALGALLRRRRK